MSPLPLAQMFRHYHQKQKAMSNNRKYRLLRQISFPEGTCYTETESYHHGNFYCFQYNGKVGRGLGYSFMISDPSAYPEWFEEIKEPETPARIEVELGGVNESMLFKRPHPFVTHIYHSSSIPTDKISSIQRAIEAVVNGDGEFKSKIDYKKPGADAYDAPPLTGRIYDEAGQWASPKQFQWTDELVKEYANTNLGGTIMDMGYFKEQKMKSREQSKQGGIK